MSIYIFHCLHFGKADGFCKITNKLVCVFSFVFMCPILETFVLREVLVDKLNFFGSKRLKLIDFTRSQFVGECYEKDGCCVRVRVA